MSKILNNSLFYVLAFASLIAFLITKYFDIGFYNFLSAFVWLAFFLQITTITSTHKRYNFPKYAVYLGIFVLYRMLSDYILVGKSINVKYLYSDYTLSGLLILLIIENAIINTKNINRLYKISYFILIIAFFVFLYQQLFDSTLFVNTNNNNITKYLYNIDISEKQLPSIYSWQSLLEVAFSFVSIGTVIVSVNFMNKNNYKAIIWILIIVVGSFLSKGRFIMLNAFILFFMYFVYNKIKIKIIIKYILGLSLVVFISIIFLEKINIPVNKIIVDRVLEENHGGLSEGSVSTRILAFQVFYQLFPEHPIFGKGHIHDTTKNSKDHELVNALAGRSSQIHVGYLSLFYYYGIIGGSIFILFLYHLMKKLKREAKQTRFWGAYFAYLGFVLANLTLVTFSVFWVGLNMALIFNRYYVLRLKTQQNTAVIPTESAKVTRNLKAL